jgi:hypothetical protein
VTQLYLQTLGFLFSHPTTRRAKVELFEPTSTLGDLSGSNSLNSELVPLIVPVHGPLIKHPFQQFLYCCTGFVAVGTYLLAKALLSNGWLYLLIENLLPSSRCCFVVYFAVVNQERVCTLQYCDVLPVNASNNLWVADFISRCIGCTRRNYTYLLHFQSYITNQSFLVA